MRLTALAALALAAVNTPSWALNILVSNDDGLSSNVKALYEALKTEGHDVIVSVPCTGQSGMGGAVKILHPLQALSHSNAERSSGGCLNGAAAAGEPPVGPMTKAGFTNGDYHYVNGTPVMATLYGLDILAPQRWGKAPDLVLSGPNEGQNAGHIVNHSGTIGNVQLAAARGLPAIALSADDDTKDNPGLANPRSAVVAQRTLELLRTLQAQSPTGPLLPPGTALNVNFPQELQGAGWHWARIGSYNTYTLKFSPNLAQDPIAQAYGLRGVPAPGVTLAVNPQRPNTAQTHDEAAVAQRHIAVSAMQVAYDAPAETQAALRQRLGALIGQ